MKKIIIFILFCSPLYTIAQGNSFEINTGSLYNLNFSLFDFLDDFRNDEAPGLLLGIAYTHHFEDDIFVKYGVRFNSERSNSVFTNSRGKKEGTYFSNRFIECPIVVRSQFSKKRFYAEYGISPYFYINSKKNEVTSFSTVNTVEKLDFETKTRCYLNTAIGFQRNYKTNQFFCQLELQGRWANFFQRNLDPFGFNFRERLDTRIGISIGCRFLQINKIQ